MESVRPPLDYLLTCSQSGLESYELSRLNRIGNLRRELRDVLEEWIEAEVNARIARWLLEGKRGTSAGLPIPELPQAEAPLHRQGTLPFLPTELNVRAPTSQFARAARQDATKAGAVPTQERQPMLATRERRTLRGACQERLLSASRRRQEKNSKPVQRRTQIVAPRAAARPSALGSARDASGHSVPTHPFECSPLPGNVSAQASPERFAQRRRLVRVPRPAPALLRSA